MKATGAESALPSNRDQSGGLLRYDSRWWLLCLSIVLLKFVLLAADPLPKYFLGDSRSYLWTAMTGWIPPDRSYFYGYFIRWLSLPMGSLTPLLIWQALAGATTAIILAWICSQVFRLPYWLSALFGFACCIDPLQLFWEHAVMTESLSLVCYALLLQRAFCYLEKCRVLDLAIVQMLSTVTIGLRISYLVLLIVLGIILPLLAFSSLAHRSSSAPALDKERDSFGSRRTVRLALHLALSIGLMLTLHTAYRRATGLLLHRPPAYLYGTGFQLLSTWAPALQPEDGADEKMRGLIERGNEFGMRNPGLRQAQRFRRSGMVSRLLELEQNDDRADEIARQTALHALKRNPFAIARIASGTYLKFWDGRRTKRLANNDVSGRKFTKEDVRIAQEFHQVIHVGKLDEQRASWMARYYVGAWPYYLIVLASPLLLLLVFLVQRPADIQTVFLGLNSMVLFGSTFFFSIFPIVRYLQPLSFLAMLTMAATAKIHYDRSGARQSRS